MKLGRMLSAVGLLALWTSAAVAADFNISESRKSVVYVRAVVPGYSVQEGSGFIVSKDGLIYTNRHVVIVDTIDAELAGFKPAAPSPAVTWTVTSGSPRGATPTTPTTTPARGTTATRGAATTPARGAAAAAPATRSGSSGAAGSGSSGLSGSGSSGLSGSGSSGSTPRGTGGTVSGTPGSVPAGTVVVVGVQSLKDPDVLEFFRADVVYASPPKDPLDFAVLKIAAKGSYGSFRAMPLNEGKAELGASVAALGFPAVDENPSLSFTKGSVSTAVRKIDTVTYCQTDAAVNPGNSGGPLINTAGEALGIVSLRSEEATNVGFALYLSQVKAAAATAAKNAVSAHPEPGPYDSTKMAAIDAIPIGKSNWTMVTGTMDEGKMLMHLDNRGAPFLMASKKSLPAAFQIAFPCRWSAESLAGAPATARGELRVRFATDETKDGLTEPKGYELRWNQLGLALFREGSTLSVAQHQISPRAYPSMLCIAYKNGALLVTVNEIPVLTYRDGKPLSGKAKFCIGGSQTLLSMGQVEVVDLTDIPPMVLPQVITPPGSDIASRLIPQVIVIQQPGAPGATPGTPGRGTPTPTVPGRGATPGGPGVTVPGVTVPGGTPGRGRAGAG